MSAYIRTTTQYARSSDTDADAPRPPTLNVSPTDTDASSNSLCKGHTVQMTFVDRVPDLDNLKTVLLALAYAYTGEGRTLQAWNGFAWNRGGPSSGRIRGDAESLSVQH
ncbi:hypothetical protein BJY52DRAFT_1198616 [Lactarius psammicola]|nr:hypothetical protein BJY52DRAFT_1198616 [Lactarius psammicola]